MTDIEIRGAGDIIESREYGIALDHWMSEDEIHICVTRIRDHLAYIGQIVDERTWVRTPQMVTVRTLARYAIGDRTHHQRPAPTVQQIAIQVAASNAPPLEPVTFDGDPTDLTALNKILARANYRPTHKEKP